MPLELWGAADSIGLSLPQRPLEYLLLLLYVSLLVYVLYLLRDRFQQQTSQDWYLTVGLAVAGLITSQLFPIHLSFNNQLAPLSAALNPITVIVPFAVVPLMFAATLLNPAGTLLVGMATGLGVSLGQTHDLFPVFNYGLVGLLMVYFVQQNYQGPLFHWLRKPLLAGPISMGLLAMILGFATFVSADPNAGNLAAFDLATSTVTANFLPLIIEGFIAGGIVMLIWLGAPQLKPELPELVPTPWQRSLGQRLMLNFVLFAAIVLVLVVFVVYNVAVSVSTTLVVNQMAHNAQTVSEQIPGFRSNLQNLLSLDTENAQLLSPDVQESEKALQQLFRVNPFYRRILLVNEDQTITTYFPRDGENIALSDLEKTAVFEAIEENRSATTPASSVDDEYIVSFVVPVLDEAGQPTAALVGRVPDISLNELIVGLEGIVGRGTGFIVDERGEIIAHAENAKLLSDWQPPEELVREIETSETSPGIAYQGRDSQTNARELIYYIKGESHPWTVVITVPYDTVLNLALSIGVPLAGVMVVITAFFYTIFAFLGRDITQPITELAEASESMAQGDAWRPERMEQRDDEIGQLTRAFTHMQSAVKQRLNESSLLLNVSQDVSSSLDITRGMPAILRGAYQGTDAAGARAVVQNPSTNQPLTFGEGAAANAMAKLDRSIINALRHTSELVLETPEAVQESLNLDQEQSEHIQALIALPLYSKERFQGMIWAGYRHPHKFDTSEKNLLNTLAGQAAVLVENARLFANSEGGRRRLAAVLASTSDGVIVTDQTERVLLVNRAMENMFGLKANEVVGRPASSVLPAPALVEALTSNNESARNPEVPIGKDKVFYASTSTIVGNDGQVMGRVAVLHDITHLKEIDAMKSDFVATVSHDLRSPLTFMRGYATMLTMIGEMNEKQEDYVEKILGGIDQMAKLVDDLLDLGRIESGTKLREDTIEIEPLLADLATEHWQHAHLRGIKLEVDVNPKDMIVVGDKRLIRQALTNLVSNGIKYAPDSGRMELRAERVKEEVVFSVADHGPGITKQDQMRLFERFYRAQEKGTEKVKGSGLGLAIVKSIAEKHGGRAWCQSKRGKGSTFFVAIPLSDNGAAPH
jgi:PAS domain S-box-containing protein